MTRVLYVHTASNVWKSLIEKFEAAGWQPVCYCGMGGGDDYLHDSLRSVPQYSYRDALLGVIPDWIDTPCCLDHDVLSYIENYETMLLEIPSRFEVFGCSLSYEERREFLYQVVRIFVSILRKLKPDVLVAASVPHRFVDNIWHLVCEYYSIPTMYLEHVRVADRKFVISDLNDRGRCLEPGVTSKEDLSDDLRLFLENQRSDYESARPRYLSPEAGFSVCAMSRKKRMLRFLGSYPRILALLELAVLFGKGRLGALSGVYCLDRQKRLRWATERVRVFARARHSVQILKARKFYFSQCTEPDYDKPYVYFAPHYQPERSSCPDAGIYHDMAMIAETISKSLPKGWSLYYKEHPRSLEVPTHPGNPRTISYYKGLKANCPDIVFLKPDVNPFGVMDMSKCVASGTGTSLLQGVLRGKPGLLFGDASFSRAPGIYKIQGVDDCRHVLNEIQSGKTSWGGVEVFLKTVDVATCRYELYFKDMISIRRTGCTVLVDDVSCRYEIDSLAREFVEKFKSVIRQTGKVS